MMTVYGRILLAGGGSAAILLGALGFQLIGGLVPCPLCIWQRWPHLLAVLVALAAVTLLWRQRRYLAGLGAVLMMLSTGLGVYHAGVEQDWWPGPTTCTSDSVAGKSVEALMSEIMAAPLVRCDEIVWDLFGITMAGWNAIISAGLAVLWIGAVIWWKNPYESSSASQ